MVPARIIPLLLMARPRAKLLSAPSGVFRRSGPYRKAFKSLSAAMTVRYEGEGFGGSRRKLEGARCRWPVDEGAADVTCRPRRVHRTAACPGLREQARRVLHVAPGGAVIRVRLVETDDTAAAYFVHTTTAPHRPANSAGVLASPL